MLRFITRLAGSALLAAVMLLPLASCGESKPAAPPAGGTPAATPAAAPSAPAADQVTYACAGCKKEQKAAATAAAPS